ncbi:MAG: hypothetical protein ABI192_15165 [Bradyrhizobium sp.]
MPTVSAFMIWSEITVFRQRTNQLQQVVFSGRTRQPRSDWADGEDYNAINPMGYSTTLTLSDHLRFAERLASKGALGYSGNATS